MVEINAGNMDLEETLKRLGKEKGDNLPQEELIRPVLSQLMDQCRALMVQQLEKQARREAIARATAQSQYRLRHALDKYAAVEEDIQGAILERVQARLSNLTRKGNHVDQIRARLSDIIRKEVQVVAEDLLASSNELLDMPSWASDGQGDNQDLPRQEGGGVAGVVTEEVEPQSKSVDAGDLYQGAVELHVSPYSALSSLTRLISGLRQMPNLRVQHIVGSRHVGTNIRIQLLDALPLLGILREMGEIGEVDAVEDTSGNGDLTLLHLKLKEDWTNGYAPEPNGTS